MQYSYLPAILTKGFFIIPAMIGLFSTIDPESGQRIEIRYTRVNSRIRITSICDASGNDIWGQFSSEKLQSFKSDILNIAK